MRYYKVLQYGDDDTYSVKETLIDEPTFRQYQKLIAEGKEKLVLKDRIISVSSIKEIIPADDEIIEYQQQGVRIDGLLEPAEKPKQITGNVRKVSDYLKETRDAFYKRMGWKL